MKKPGRWLVAIAAIAIVGGAYWYSQNHLDEAQIAQTVRTELQHQLDTGPIERAHLQVGKVTVLHDQGNRYRAIASVAMDGSPHDVPLDVMVDGKKIEWNPESGAFAFVIEKAFAGVLRQAQALDQRQTPGAPSAGGSQ